MEKDIVKERLDFVQEVIDRLIYLSPEEKDRYKKEIEKLNVKFNIEVGYVDELRIIKSRINGKTAHV